MELTEAMLDGKILCPENFISDFTDGSFLLRGDKAVGFINDIPATFRWHDNYMRITTTLCSETLEALKYVNKVAAEIMEGTGNKHIDVSHFQNIIWIKFFWTNK